MKHQYYWIPVYIGSNLHSKFETFISKNHLMYTIDSDFASGTIIESTDDLVVYHRQSKNNNIDISNCVVYKKVRLDFNYELLEKAILKFKIKSIS
jgi:hypothetical protein